jgi:hypothetical protein
MDTEDNQMKFVTYEKNTMKKVFHTITDYMQMTHDEKKYSGITYRNTIFEFTHPENATLIERMKILQDQLLRQKLLQLNSTSNEEFFEIIDNTEEYIIYNQTIAPMLDKIEKKEIDFKTLSLKTLKRLQVIDLLTNRGVFQALNISIDADDFLDVINEFDKYQEKSNLVDLPWKFTWITLFDPKVSEILTEYGLCYSFNIATSDKMFKNDSVTSDLNYKLFNFRGKSETLPIPRRTIHLTKGFYFNARYSKDFLKNLINIQNDGFILLIHDPYEYPSKHSSQMILNDGIRKKVFIDPKIYDIDDSLLEMSPKERNCYVKDEKHLKFFNVYTKNNCEMECLTDFMINRCNCVEFFMIRNLTTKICRANEKNCYDKAKVQFNNQKEGCNCLAPCSYVKYEFINDDFGFDKK